MWLWKYISLYFDVLNVNSEFLKGRGLLVVTYKIHYVGTTFTLKINSNDIFFVTIFLTSNVLMYKNDLKSLIEVGLHLRLFEVSSAGVKHSLFFLFFLILNSNLYTLGLLKYLQM